MKLIRFFLLFQFAVAAIGCNRTPISLIFETDMGNDIDDALALVMVNRYIDDSKVNCLMVGINKSGLYPAQYVDIVNTFYGHPEIPIGISNNADSEDSLCYAAKVAQMKLPDGETPLFARSVEDYKTLPSAVELYRKILSGQPDNSVVIASVGFSTNLAMLLETQADEYSSLTGMELVAKKVRLLSVMAGSCDGTGRREYNVICDVASCKKLFDLWPTEIVVSPWELGIDVKYPANSIINDFNWAPNNPYTTAYRLYGKFPEDKPSWDPTSVLYAVEGSGQWFVKSSPLDMSITDEGEMKIKSNPSGNRYFISSDSVRNVKIVNHLVELAKFRPKSK